MTNTDKTAETTQITVIDSNTSFEDLFGDRALWDTSVETFRNRYKSADADNRRMIRNQVETFETVSRDAMNVHATMYAYALKTVIAESKSGKSDKADVDPIQVVLDRIATYGAVVTNLTNGTIAPSDAKPDFADKLREAIKSGQTGTADNDTVSRICGEPVEKVRGDVGAWVAHHVESGKIGQTAMKVSELLKLGNDDKGYTPGQGALSARLVAWHDKSDKCPKGYTIVKSPDLAISVTK